MPLPLSISDPAGCVPACCTRAWATWIMPLAGRGIDEEEQWQIVHRQANPDAANLVVHTATRLATLDAPKAKGPRWTLEGDGGEHHLRRPGGSSGGLGRGPSRGAGIGRATTSTSHPALRVPRQAGTPAHGQADSTGARARWRVRWCTTTQPAGGCPGERPAPARAVGSIPVQAPAAAG